VLLFVANEQGQIAVQQSGAFSR
jgi:hypothetical protein